MDETAWEVGQSKNHLVIDLFGVPCMLEIFNFPCPLFNAIEHVGVGPISISLAYDEDVPLFALGLINSAIELGGASLGHHPEILALGQNDLFYILMHFGLSPSLLILTIVCSIVLNLYHLMCVKLKLQLEAFFSCVLMKIAVNKHGASYQQQEVSMETIVDLCRQPTFIYEMYANYDCDISCSNVFEDPANLFSKSAFPVNSPLSVIYVLALEGLIAMVSGMAKIISNEVLVLEMDASTLEDHEPFWNVKCRNYENLDCWVPYIHKTKHVKKKLMIDRLDPTSVAYFLRYISGLDKKLVGDYLGDHDQLCVDVLQEFAKTFDFQEKNLDIALQVFLETFRLPCESQKIQRVHTLEVVSYLGMTLNGVVSSYSLIMLNTDQHNAQVKKKMTEEDFIRNNRLINGCNDLPREYLSELYHSICENEIRMTPEQGVMTHDNWVGFTIANLYGDYIRSGWQNILDCILSLHNLGLLPTRLARDAADDLEPNSEPDSRVSPLVVKPTLPPVQNTSLGYQFSEFVIMIRKILPHKLLRNRLKRVNVPPKLLKIAISRVFHRKQSLTVLVACLRSSTSSSERYGEAVEPTAGTEVDQKKNNTTVAMLYQALSENMILQIANLTSAKDIWDTLKVRHIGVDRVKEARLQTLESGFESLKMDANDSLDVYAGKISEIASQASSLGHTLDDKRLIRKLLGSVPEKFIQIVAAIEQFADLNTMPFQEAVGRLKASEERTKKQTKEEDMSSRLLFMETDKKVKDKHQRTLWLWKLKSWRLWTRPGKRSGVQERSRR
nr:ARF guanine-nucleotide exchange factor GNOM-like [Tanacetum cinerariifolium]